MKPAPPWIRLPSSDLPSTSHTPRALDCGFGERNKMDKMQSFKTNDNVTLKYFDTGAAEEGEDEKPWLILVR